MLFADWCASDIGDGTPDFTRRDAVIGRTSADIPLLMGPQTGESYFGARLMYITQAVATPGGGGASSFSELTGQIADDQVPDGFTRDTELAAYAPLAGAAFTGQVTVGAPPDGENSTRVAPTSWVVARIAAAISAVRDGVVSTFDTLAEIAAALDTKANLAGATFTGSAKGVTPVDNADFATKAYVDGLIIQPTHTADQYLAVRADDQFAAGDFDPTNNPTTSVAYPDNSHTATVPNSGLTDARLAIARLASDTDLVYLDINGSGVNSLGAFTKQTGTFTIGGDTYEWWLSDNTGTWDGLMIQAR